MALPDLKVFTPDDFLQPVVINVGNGWSAPEKLAEGTGFKIGLSFINSGTSDASNIEFTVHINGELLFEENVETLKRNYYYIYSYGEVSLNPGTYNIVFTIDPDNLISESDESNNTFRYQLLVNGPVNWLMKTNWGQSNILFDSDIAINKFAPIDPVTSERCITGCVNTAIAQILYYFASQGHDFTVDLTADDSFVSGGKITIDGTKKNADGNGNLSFAEINGMLENFDTDSAEDIAALCYAAGVIGKASFGSSETATSTGKEVFIRAGFKSVSEAYSTYSDLWSNGKISDKGWNMLISNMESGTPVLMSIANPSHAVAVDGYDAVSDRIHINFGWEITGGKKYDYDYGMFEGSGWYSRDECDQLEVKKFVYNITPDTSAPVAGTVNCQYAEKYAVLSLDFTDDVGVWKKYYSLGQSDQWHEFTSSINVKNNTTVYFKACDRAKNYSAVKSFSVTGIIEEIIISVAASTTEYTNGSVFLDIVSPTEISGLTFYFRINSGAWNICSDKVEITENCTVDFYALSSSGSVSNQVSYTVNNIDKIAPDLQITGNSAEWTNKDIILTAAASDGKVEYFDGTKWINGNILNVSENGIYKFRATDMAGNVTEKQVVVDKINKSTVPQNPYWSADSLIWDPVVGINEYQLELIKSDRNEVIYFDICGNGADLFLPGKNSFFWQVSADGNTWIRGNDIVVENHDPQKFISDSDGDIDLFFANSYEIWHDGYFAEHHGIIDNWYGTDKKISLAGKNKINDLFIGSTDNNTLVLTDDLSGDALFLEDIYTDLPTAVTAQQARIAQINQICAGAGDDIIDLTSRKFIYSGNAIKICGGSGNDIIWTNNGNNIIYGDAGNDQICGGFGNDFIIGGTGNDYLHGGGGNDIFCFGNNWGNDIVEQLDSGTVTLHFESNTGIWDQTALTYIDGNNSVKISGAADVILKFGDSDDLPDAAFADFSGEKIFRKNLS